MEIMYIPMILFLVVVAPLWIIFHYHHKTKISQGFSEGQMHDIETMLETLDKLGKRIETLEEILDQQCPEWRKNTDSARSGTSRKRD